MKAIINDKMYDTEKAERIYEFRRKVDEGEILNTGLHYTPYHDVVLYKTAKGNWFEHDITNDTIAVLTEDKAREIIRRLAPDIYVKMFGEVEEA